MWRTKEGMQGKERKQYEYTAFLHNFIKKNFVLYTSAFITGGNYKIVSPDGSSVFLERTCSVRIKIGYKKN